MWWCYLCICDVEIWIYIEMVLKGINAGSRDNTNTKKSTNRSLKPPCFARVKREKKNPDLVTSVSLRLSNHDDLSPSFTPAVDPS